MTTEPFVRWDGAIWNSTTGQFQEVARPALPQESNNYAPGVGEADYFDTLFVREPVTSENQPALVPAV